MSPSISFLSLLLCFLLLPSLCFLQILFFLLVYDIVATFSLELIFELFMVWQPKIVFLYNIDFKIQRQSGSACPLQLPHSLTSINITWSWKGWQMRSQWEMTRTSSQWEISVRLAAMDCNTTVLLHTHHTVLTHLAWRSVKKYKCVYILYFSTPFQQKAYSHQPYILRWIAWKNLISVRNGVVMIIISLLLLVCKSDACVSMAGNYNCTLWMPHCCDWV